MEFRAPDGTLWTVQVRTPSASHAMIVFEHPSDATSRINRYAWYQYGGPEARDVSGRLGPRQVMDALTADDIARLFRVSMPITTHRAMDAGFAGVDPAALTGANGATAVIGPNAAVTAGGRNQGLAGLFSQPPAARGDE